MDYGYLGAAMGSSCEFLLRLKNVRFEIANLVLPQMEQGLVISSLVITDRFSYFAISALCLRGFKLSLSIWLLSGQLLT